MREHHKRRAGRLSRVDKAALQEESLVQVQSILEALRGKTVGCVRAEARRIVIETTEGNRFLFGAPLTA